MKKILLLAALLITANSYAFKAPLKLAKNAAVLESYTDIFNALLDGKDLSYVMSIDDCTVNGKKVEKPAFALGLFQPQETIVANDYSIVSSMHHFTTNDNHAPGKPVYQYATYRVSSDNVLTVAVEVFDAAYHTPISSKVTYQCALGFGAAVIAK